MLKKLASILSVVFAVHILAACSSDGGNRYQNNADLERPPEVPGAGKSDDLVSPKEASESGHRRHGMGLKSDIYKHDDSLAFKIRRRYDEAWILLHQAIEHNELKIADQDRSKGTFYVNYDGRFLLNLTDSLFGGKENKPTYLIKVEGQGTETQVSFSLANKEEQAASTQTDKSEELLNLLYDTLHDHIKSE